jgi:hypothetical protein
MVCAENSDRGGINLLAERDADFDLAKITVTIKSIKTGILG